MKRLWNSSFQSLFYRLKVQLLKILIFIPYGNCAFTDGRYLFFRYILSGASTSNNDSP